MNEGFMSGGGVCLKYSHSHQSIYKSICRFVINITSHNFTVWTNLEWMMIGKIYS